MKNSQYTNDYLETNKTRGDNHGLTIGSYLSYHLHGKAKKYAGHYVIALRRTMKRMEKKGLVERGPSVMGREAWYPK